MALSITDYVSISASDSGGLLGIGQYLPKVDLAANGPVLTRLAHAASRFIDSTTGTYFYAEQATTKYFDLIDASGNMRGSRQISTGMHPFYAVTTVTLAYYENQLLNQWLTLNGDGITPPSNFYLWPPNPKGYSSLGVYNLKPWWGLDLAHVPSPNTQFLPVAMGGYKTIGINASWGWPAVPDTIMDIAAKAVSRAWMSLQAGHQVTGGSAEIGRIDMSRHFDEKDLEILASSEWVALAI